MVAAAALALSPAVGQTVISFSMGGDGTQLNPLEMSRVERSKLANSTLECTYDYNYVTDTLDRTKTKSDVMILQTGGAVSKFYSYTTFRVDSLVATAVSADAIMANIGNYVGGERWSVYKNHSTGKISTTDKIGMDYYLVEEPLEPQAWRITGETRTIQGYACQRADCDYRGRRWVAWFTPEIPISEGPWKLSGLPGLILEAADSRGDHSFSLSGLRRVDDGSVSWPKHQYMKANRRDYLRTARKFIENPMGMVARSGAIVKVMTSDGKEITPTIETMKYDFLEADIK